MIILISSKTLGWKTSNLRHSNVGVYGKETPTNPSRRLRCRKCCPRWLRLRYAFWWDSKGRLSHSMHSNYGCSFKRSRGCTLEPTILWRSYENCKITFHFIVLSLSISKNMLWYDKVYQQKLNWIYFRSNTSYVMQLRPQLLLPFKHLIAQEQVLSSGWLQLAKLHISLLSIGLIAHSLPSQEMHKLQDKCNSIVA